MRTHISSKGQIVLPAELRREDGIRPGQEFEIQRLDRGDYRFVLRELPNQGLVDCLLACPVKGFLDEMPRGESTDSIRPDIA